MSACMNHWCSKVDLFSFEHGLSGYKLDQNANQNQTLPTTC